MTASRFGLLVVATALVLSGCTTPEERAREALDAGARALERADRAGAVTQLTKATELDPSLTEAWALLADAQLRGEFWAAARDAARRAAQLEPRSAAHQEAIGRACLPLEAWPDARDAFTRALELDPARAPLHYELARVHERLEAREEALAAYQAALAAGVEPLRTRLALARLAFDAGDQVEARRLLDEAAALPGEPPDDARAQLAELREDLAAREAVAQREAAEREAFAQGEAAARGDASSAERQARLESERSNLALLAILGAGGDSSGGAIADVLRGGDLGDLDDALSSASGVGVAQGGGSVRRGGGIADSGDGAIGELHGPEGTGILRPPSGPASTVSLGAPIVTGGDAEAVRRVMRTQLGRYRACHERSLRSNPSLAGRLTLLVAADDQGRVHSVDVASTTLNDPETERCVAQGLQRLHLPASDSPEGWIITQPLDFSTEQP